MQYSMEFKEVESINKEVIVKIKDMINLKELKPYMEKWFSPVVSQGICADMQNYGPSYAVTSFLDAVKKRPNTFQKWMAALRHTGQSAVYNKFMQEVKKYFKNRRDRLDQIFSLIAAEERELSDDPDDYHIGHSILASAGNGAVQQGSGSHPSNYAPPTHEQVIYRRDAPNQAPSRDNPHRVPHTLGSRAHSDGELEKQTHHMTPSVSQPSLDSNISGATGNVAQGIQNMTLSAQIDPNLTDKKISSLKANVYKMLGKALEKTNENGDDQEPWWNHIINNGDLNVSRKEQRQIGKCGSPGVEFLDVLDDRDYTLGDLQRLLTQFQIKEALDILLRHQNKVIEERHHIQTDKNNLNRNQDVKADQSKVLNISVQQTIDPQDLEKEKNSSIQLLQKRADSVQNDSGERSSVQLTSQPSRTSLDSNTSISLPSIEDEPEKGTQAVPAHGDPSGKQSQPNEERDAQMLQYDRVHQFDNNPEALEQTSFIPVNRGQTAGCGDYRRDIPGELCDNRGQISNQSSPHNSSVHTNVQSAPDNPRGSGNIPLLSQFSSIDSNNEDQVQDPNVRPEGIVSVLPRNLTTFEENTTAAGVTFVPRSGNMSSSEITADISNEEQEAESNLTSVDSSDVNVSMQATDQGTDTENLTSDMKGNTEK